MQYVEKRRAMNGETVNIRPQRVVMNVENLAPAIFEASVKTFQPRAALRKNIRKTERMQRRLPRRLKDKSGPDGRGLSRLVVNRNRMTCAAKKNGCGKTSHAGAGDCNIMMMIDGRRPEMQLR